LAEAPPHHLTPLGKSGRRFLQPRLPLWCNPIDPWTIAPHNRLIGQPMNESEKGPSHRTNLEDVGRRVDEEIEEFIRWFNQDVVPSARKHSSGALRKASEKLAEFAE